MNQPTIEELESQIAALEAEIEQITKPLRAQCDELRKQVRRLKLEAFAALYGLRKGDELAITDSLLAVARERVVTGEWSDEYVKKLSDLDYGTVEHIAPDAKVIRIDLDSWSSEIPLEVVLEMRHAWLKRNAAARTALATVTRERDALRRPTLVAPPTRSQDGE